MALGGGCCFAWASLVSFPESPLIPQVPDLPLCFPQPHPCARRPNRKPHIFCFCMCTYIGGGSPVTIVTLRCTMLYLCLCRVFVH